VAVIVVYTGGELLINIARVKLDLSGAYVNRAEFVAAGLPLKGYYFHWLALVFNPVFLVWAVLKRKWWVIPFLLLLQFRDRLRGRSPQLLSGPFPSCSASHCSRCAPRRLARSRWGCTGRAWRRS